MRNIIKSIAGIALVGILILGMTACAASGGQYSAASVTVAEAKELVRGYLNDENAIITERDMDDGYYELEVISNGIEYEVKVHPNTGEIIKVEKDGRGTQTSKPSADAASPTRNTAAIGMERAKELVKEYLNDENAIITERDMDDGYYELEVISNGIEYEVKVHPNTGEIVKTEKDCVDDRCDDDDYVPTGAIGADRAQELARQYLNDADARIEEWELDDGKYELEVISGGKKYDIEVHATTGEILKAERDD